MAASKINHMYDALLALRNLTDRASAVTSTGQGGGTVHLHQITSGGSVTPVAGLPGALGDLVGKFGTAPFDVVLFVDNIDTQSGTETYALKLQSVDANGANLTDVPGGAITITSAMVGQPIVLKIDPANIKLADDDAQGVVITHTLGGATPSMHYYAFASRLNSAS